MTSAAFLALLAAGCLSALSAALAVRAFLYVALLIALILFYAWLSAWLSRRTTRLYVSLSEQQVLRGEPDDLVLKAHRSSPLPAGALTILWREGEGDSARQVTLNPGLRRDAQVSLPVSTAHVGQFILKVEQARWEDLFGLVVFRKTGFQAKQVTVLPRPFPIEKPSFSAAEEGAAALRRAAEDYNAPDDLRSWQPGDAMKRVQWKLYARKGELLVRQYESPMPPDTLILLDCGKTRGGTPELSARFQDALCETAVAVADLQMKDGQKVRMPLYGREANEFASDHRDHLLILQRMLAAQSFGAEEDFARVIREEMKRVRRSGAVVALTTRLTADAADALCDLRRLGPNVRCYLVTDQMEREEDLPYVAQLQRHLVEVCYVTPA